MVNDVPHILLLEPYYGGSHQAFLNGLQKHVDCNFTLLTLPARKWKMRMQLAAPWFAAQIKEYVVSGERYDAILTSTFLDVAVLRSMLASQGIHLPLAVYFHENQFSYPGQISDPGIFQFTNINFTSALCADSLAFNSQYNLETFLKGIHGFLKKSTDMELRYLEEVIRNKSRVIYPGLDYSIIDKAECCIKKKSPVLVWNHRWEHDKDPELFFKALFSLKDCTFQLIVLGEQFRYSPDIFVHARERLAEKIVHFGFAETREEYAVLLKCGDIVVSTARHEFFGFSVLEGVRAGCRPLVPDKLSYQELFAQKYRYQEDQLAKYLRNLIDKPGVRLRKDNCMVMTQPYSWGIIAPEYTHWFESLVNTVIY